MNPKTISSTLKKVKKRSAPHIISPIRNPELTRPSETNVYDIQMFIGSPTIATKINI